MKYNLFRECDNYIEGERVEMVELYESKGMSTKDAEAVVQILSKDKRIFVEIMMIEELKLLPIEDNPRTSGLANILYFYYPLRGILLLLLIDYCLKFSNLYFL